jgi:hypothetical protein
MIKSHLSVLGLIVAGTAFVVAPEQSPVRMTPRIIILRLEGDTARFMVDYQRNHEFMIGLDSAVGVSESDMPEVPRLRLTMLYGSHRWDEVARDPAISRRLPPDTPGDLAAQVYFDRQIGAWVVRFRGGFGNGLFYVGDSSKRLLEGVGIRLGRGGSADFGPVSATTPPGPQPPRDRDTPRGVPHTPVR